MQSEESRYDCGLATMRAIFGADPKDAGAIYLNGQEIPIKKPREDRKSVV
jgi:ABC-type sugar transport system ATPase subunit